MIKAVHESNGTSQIFITNKSDKYQRQALISISSGQAKDEWGICTICRYNKISLEPKFEMIKVKIDGKRSSFSIKDIAGVQVESFINPVTREE
ncbi:MAG TPA: DUF1326 domain-containing protein [Nitrososphaeraceae archaeon]|nr:DUF1326 domain-containing protein [Nitrososphaeraceae archaeon]